MENMDIGYMDQSSTMTTSWEDWNTAYVNLNHHHRMNHSLNDSINSSFCGSDFSSHLDHHLFVVYQISVQADSFTGSNLICASSWEEQAKFFPYHQTSSINDHDELRLEPNDNNGHGFEDVDYRDPSRHYLTARKNTGGRRGRCLRSSMQSSSFSIISQSPTSFTTVTSLSNGNIMKPRSVQKRDSTGEEKLKEELDDWGDFQTTDFNDDSRATKCCRTN